MSVQGVRRDLDRMEVDEAQDASRPEVKAYDDREGVRVVRSRRDERNGDQKSVKDNW